MNNGVVDRISLKQLQSEYDIGKSAFYDRLAALEIKPEKTTKGSFLNAEQFQLFYELDCFIESGGKIADFVAQRKCGGSAAEDVEVLSIGQAEEPPPLLGATIFSPTIQLLPPAPNPILEAETRRRVLREASVHGDVLTTHELLALLELRQLPRGCGEQFERRGFVFTRVRKGREGEWRVERGCL